MNQPEEGEEFIKKGRRLIGSAGGQAKITVNQRRADKKADKQMKGLQQQLL